MELGRKPETLNLKCFNPLIEGFAGLFYFSNSDISSRAFFAYSKSGSASFQ